MHFDGATYTHDRDGKRLGAQYIRVLQTMQDGQWHSLKGISEVTGDPESSVSARLRDMRKERFGSLNVERRYVGSGLFEYKLNMPQTAEQIIVKPEVLKDEKNEEEWIPHVGRQHPLTPDTLVHVRCLDGWESVTPWTVQRWSELGDWWAYDEKENCRIVAYKIHKR